MLPRISSDEVLERTLLRRSRSSQLLETTMTQPIEARPALAKEPGSVTEDVLRRVQAEFLEMPGLRVTEAQACRLLGLDAATCSALLGD